jgi:hypothetical protein
MAMRCIAVTPIASAGAMITYRRRDDKADILWLMAPRARVKQ